MSFWSRIFGTRSLDPRPSRTVAPGSAPPGTRVPENPEERRLIDEITKGRALDSLSRDERDEIARIKAFYAERPLVGVVSDVATRDTPESGNDDTDDAITDLILGQLLQMRQVDRGVDRFVAATLDQKDVLSSVVIHASDKLRLTMQDGKGHSCGIIADPAAGVVVNVSTLPVTSEEASQWFTAKYGGYVAYLDSVYKDQLKPNDRRVLVHFIVGARKGELWASHALFTFSEPHLRWIFPEGCLSEIDRAQLAKRKRTGR